MIDLSVNGQTHSIEADPDTPLLYVLREELQLNAAKFGCGLGQCGACTVLIDGLPALSCVTPILLLPGRRIVTLEGLGTANHPAPIQQAFIEEQAAQCGYCIAGMMMRAQALLQRNPGATEQEIRRQLEPNLCRCGTHMRILRAVRRAGSLMQSGASTAAPADDVQRRERADRARDETQQPTNISATGESARRPAGAESAPSGDRDSARHPERRERPER